MRRIKFIISDYLIICDVNEQYFFSQNLKRWMVWAKETATLKRWWSSSKRRPSFKSSFGVATVMELPRWFETTHEMDILTTILNKSTIHLTLINHKTESNFMKDVLNFQIPMNQSYDECKNKSIVKHNETDVLNSVFVLHLYTIVHIEMDVL